MASVVIQDLCIRFGQNEVIKGLCLDVVDGEFLVLLGPSGCGKSTLLHSIAGLIDVADGRIDIGGVDMTWADPTDRNIGMVFQSYALYPTMTVERNMSFGLRINGMPKAEIERRVGKVSTMLQLQSLLQRKPSQLSGGQRQRVAIGRALVREAGVFLFDEPLSNLDAKLRAELRRELKLLHKNLGNTMIYVTHDQVEAMTLATRIVVMRGGHIQQIGTPEQVYDKPANLFVAGFLGSPPMNMLKGQLRVTAEGRSFCCGDMAIDVSAYPWQEAVRDTQDVLLGIRPENVRIHDDGPFVGKVTLIEPMGNHHVVWLAFQGNLLSCVLTGNLELSLDQSVRFGMEVRHVSLFDAAAESRI